MIKIKLSNWNKGRNKPTFRPFLIYSHHFSEIGVQFVEGGSYDYEFVGMYDFINKKISLEDSIKYGIETLQNKKDDFYLFDGSDSTSLMGAWEVLKSSNAKALYKNQILKREHYKTPTAFNKWFFGNNSGLDLSYDINEEDYNNKLRLTGYNLGYHNPNYLNFDQINLTRDIDVCAIYQGFHPECYDHGERNDLVYSNHRVDAWNMLDSIDNITHYKDKRPFNEYVNILRRSKCTLSPFGMGEVCFRDFEIIQYGSVMIKPDMSNVVTYPNLYIPYETYIPCKLDWSDLEEKINWVKDNPIKAYDIIKNAREVFKKKYTVTNLIQHWIKEFTTFNGIEIC